MTTIRTKVHEPLDFEVLADGLGFPEGPCIREDGSVLAVDIDHGTIVETIGGAPKVLATPGGGPNGMALAGDGTRLRRQQRRLPVDRDRRVPHPDRPRDAHERAARLREGLDRADRPRHRCGHGPPRLVQRSVPARPQRPRVRRGRRALVHRPRQGPPRQRGPRRALLPAAGWRRGAGDRLPAARAERRGAVAGQPPGLRGRDPHRPALGLGARVARRRAPRRQGRWPSATAGSASRRRRSRSTRSRSRRTGASRSAPSPTASSSSRPTAPRSTSTRSPATSPPTSRSVGPATGGR